jgi:hypothetical protein
MGLTLHFTNNMRKLPISLSLTSLVLIVCAEWRMFKTVDSLYPHRAPVFEFEMVLNLLQKIPIEFPPFDQL